MIFSRAMPNIARRPPLSPPPCSRIQRGQRAEKMAARQQRSTRRCAGCRRSRLPRARRSTERYARCCRWLPRSAAFSGIDGSADYRQEVKIFHAALQHKAPEDAAGRREERCLNSDEIHEPRNHNFRRRRRPMSAGWHTAVATVPPAATR